MRCRPFNDSQSGPIAHKGPYAVNAAGEPGERRPRAPEEAPAGCLLLGRLAAGPGELDGWAAVHLGYSPLDLRALGRQPCPSSFPATLLQAPLPLLRSAPAFPRPPPNTPPAQEMARPRGF